MTEVSDSARETATGETNEDLPSGFWDVRRMPVPEGMSPLRRIAFAIRLPHWWNYKIPPALGVGYSLTWLLAVPLHEVTVPLALLFLGGITAGIFASVFNDLMDFRQDWQAGKLTGVMTYSRGGRMGWLLFSLALMLAEWLLLLPYPRAQVCFLVIWLIHVAYTLPPIRLKEKGIWGVLCIAAGEHLLAALLATMLILDATGKLLPTVWFVALMVWSAMIGIRSILWHQLCDFVNDRKANSRTFGARYSYDFLKRLGERVIFPVEATAFALMLYLSHNPLAWAILAVHLYIEWTWHQFTEANFTLVAPAPNHRFALFEYYQVFWPLAFVLPGLGRDSGALPLLALQLLLFPQPIRDCLVHLGSLLRWRVWVFLLSRGQWPETPKAMARRRQSEQVPE
ncbi:MAG: hypothetical protein SFU56_05950 [Capsulimonadales bacterium]|nr:hypothetical protein [Capsulimonadales bacterium]